MCCNVGLPGGTAVWGCSCNVATCELAYPLADDIFGSVLEGNISQGLTEAARGMVLAACTLTDLSQRYMYMCIQWIA